jgi:hypothetical protein
MHDACFTALSFFLYNFMFLNACEPLRFGVLHLDIKLNPQQKHKTQQKKLIRIGHS